MFCAVFDAAAAYHHVVSLSMPSAAVVALVGGACRGSFDRPRSMLR